MPIDYKSLPKIELHCHLDASLRVSTVAELGRKIGLTLPNPLEPALVAPECCIDLADYLVRIDLALEVMQQRDHLVRIGREVVEDLAADGSYLWRNPVRAAASSAQRPEHAGSSQCSA